MNAIPCQYHAQVPARWRCASCQFNLCTQCAPKELRASAPTCPSCQRLLDSLGVGNTIKPFWERIPRFFLYPAKMGPLLVGFALSVLATLGTVPMLGRFALVAASVMSVRYCYGLLYYSALGNLEPPEFGKNSEYQGMFLKQLGLFVILFGGAGALAALTHSIAVGIVAMVGVVLLLPAAIMTLAIDESLGSAVNPLHLLGVATRIGKSYLLLWLMLLLLLTGSGWLIQHLGMVLPKAAGIFVGSFVSTYFTIAMFHMMGYVVYQYHETLGFAVTKEYAESAEGATAYSAQAIAPPPDRAQILITEGKFEEAGQELESLVRATPEDLRLHDRYFRLMLAQPDKKEQGSGHADLYIGKLIEQNKKDKAFDVYRDAMARWGALVIKDPLDTVVLAAQAQQRNDAKLGLPLLNKYAQRFPKHEKIPEAYLLAAELLSHGQGKDDMALQILEQLRRAYPEHVLKPRIENLHAALMRMKQRKAAAAPAG